MLRLTVLGTPGIVGPEGPRGGVASRRKPLALLALLATAGERGLSRDKLLAYLWPEHAPERAAHALNQLLYGLRRDLAPALVLGGSELRLNPDLLATDIGEFQAARRGGDLERAVALYAGPFLDGFFLPDAPEFERWTEGERALLARAYGEALGALAAGAAGRGEHARAADWWSRLADQQPLSSGVTLRLMTALAAAGDRASALRHAQAYQRLVRDELEAVPNPAVVAFAGELRRGAAEALLHLEPASTPPVRVAVLPFAASGSGEAAAFADALTEALVHALARSEGILVVARRQVEALAYSHVEVCELGRRLGAAALLEGSLREAGSRIRLTVQLVDTTGCYAWSEQYDREVRDAFAVQDELAGRIVTAIRTSLPSLGRGPPPESPVPHRSGILAALRRRLDAGREA